MLNYVPEQLSYFWPNLRCWYTVLYLSLAITKYNYEVFNLKGQENVCEKAAYCDKWLC
jgi:hypothetical protein